MPDCFFEPVSVTEGAVFEARYRGTSATAGPWSAESMHGGPPAALLTHAAQRTAGVPERALVARVCVEILRPIPVGTVEVRARTIRSGSRVALVEAELCCGDDVVMLARAWVIRLESELSAPRTGPVAAPDARIPLGDFPSGWSRGYLDAIEWAGAEGSFVTPGPATVWGRSRLPLIAGEEMSGAEHVALLADSGNGISAVANPADWLFVNTELTVHLLRAPVSDWIWLDAETALQSQGVGLTSTVIGDELGGVGGARQSLFVDRRR